MPWVHIVPEISGKPGHCVVDENEVGRRVGFPSTISPDNPESRQRASATTHLF